MQPEAYRLAADAEERHWWFRGRRQVLEAALSHWLARDVERRILEVGCGNGGNLPLLARYGQVFACEQDEGARQRAAARGVARVEAGSLPDDLPFGAERFDVIAAFDVLEHVAADEAALRCLGARLSPRGLLVVTVPAYAWLWGPHDELSQHQRRYVHSRLRSLLARAGFDVLHATYFNTFLFPVAAIHVILSRRRAARVEVALRVPAAPLNGLLGTVFGAERFLIPWATLPFGLSLLALARPSGSCRVTS